MSDRDFTPAGTGEDAREERLRALLSAAFAANAPTPEQRERILRAADSRSQPPERRRARRRGPFFTCPRLAFAVGCALLGLWLAPSLYAAYLLQQILPATANMRYAHIVREIVSDGSYYFLQSWYWPGGVRTDSSDGTRQMQSGNVAYTYNPRKNLLQVTPRTGGYIASDTGAIVRGELKEVSFWQWGDLPRWEGSHLHQGEPVDRIRIRRYRQRADILLLVSRANRLPVRAEITVRNEAGKPFTTIWSFEFDAYLPSHRLHPAFFPGTFFPPRPAPRILYNDTDYQAWTRSLTPALKTITVGDSVVSIRDVRVNGIGNVFVLYTASGKAPEMTLTDETGLPYLESRARFWPHAGKVPWSEPPPVEFNGLPLQGTWFAPVKELHVGNPTRALTLTFRAKQGRDIRTVRETFRSVPLFPQMMPQYMAYFRNNCLTDRDTWLGAAEARARYHRDVTQDARQALRFYLEALNAHGRRVGLVGGEGALWQNAALLYRRLGRTWDAGEAETTQRYFARRTRMPSAASRKQSFNLYYEHKLAERLLQEAKGQPTEADRQ